MTVSSQGFQYSPILATAQMIDTKNGVITGTVWPLAFQQLSNQLLTIQAVANNAFGTNFFTVATQPTLGVSDAGYVGFLTDYGHLVYWTGAAWVFLDSGNGFFQHCPVAPQGAGWQLCDGTVTNYLTLGVTLTVTAFTTPNVSGTAAYLKSGAYTGSIVAANAPGASTTVGGHTDDESAHTHNVPAQTVLSGANDFTIAVDITSAVFPVASQTHHHSVTMPAQSSDAGTAHHHGVSAVTAATTVDASGEPAHLVVPVYFRR